MRKFGEVVKTRKPSNAVVKMESGNATLQEIEMFVSKQGNPTLKLLHTSTEGNGKCDDVIKTGSVEDFMKSMTRLLYLTDNTIGENAMANVPVYYENVEGSEFVIDYSALEHEAKEQGVKAFTLLRSTCQDEVDAYVSSLDPEEQDPKFDYEYTFEEDRDDAGNKVYNVSFLKVYLEERQDTLKAVFKVLQKVQKKEIPYYVYTKLVDNKRNSMYKDCIVEGYTVAS